MGQEHRPHRDKIQRLSFDDVELSAAAAPLVRSTASAQAPLEAWAAVEAMIGVATSSEGA
jgi:hypothetical protein